ncbi:MAG: sugar phosphate isomerase/epimerase [Planctomycetes bacterium]|nr:sugar phosphate isomerase/epimerase [Planctomycetota bacterium]
MDAISAPVIGMAAWLLKGTLPQRVRWIAENGFGALSLLQSVMDVDASERLEAAAALSDAGLKATYHGNVDAGVNGNGSIDWDYVTRVVDDVLWWNDNGVKPASVCFDPLHEKTAGGARLFRWELNAQVVRFMADALAGTGIRAGIENSFGGDGAFRSIEDFERFAGMFENTGPVMLYDVGHANIRVRSAGGDGKDLELFTESIPFDIAEVHVSDNSGRMDEHRGIGRGNVDLQAVCRGLMRKRFAGQITVEVCTDILNGRYAADPALAAETTPLLITRDAILAAWEAARQG